MTISPVGLEAAVQSFLLHEGAANRIVYSNYSLNQEPKLDILKLKI